MGMVYFPKPNADSDDVQLCPWSDELVSEVLRFSGEGDEQDDQVDVLSLIGTMLNDMYPGFEPPVNEATGFDTPAFIMKQVKDLRKARKRTGKFEI